MNGHGTIANELGVNGLWKQNPTLIQMLGLCPTLAVSTSFVNAVSLGLATVVVMMIASTAVAVLRHVIPREIRIPVFIVIIAGLVTVVDLLMNAYLHSLYLVLGIFVPLIVTNCIVLARVEAFAAKNRPDYAGLDALMMGLGLVWVLALIGAIREIIGQGTLFAGIEWIVPSWSAITLFGDASQGFLLAMLPPGAFIVLGFLVAAHNALTAWQKARTKKRTLAASAPAAPTPIGGEA